MQQIIRVLQQFKEKIPFLKIENSSWDHCWDQKPLINSYIYVQFRMKQRAKMKWTMKYYNDFALKPENCHLQKFNNGNHVIIKNMACLCGYGQEVHTVILSTIWCVPAVNSIADVTHWQSQWSLQLHRKVTTNTVQQMIMVYSSLRKKYNS